MRLESVAGPYHRPQRRPTSSLPGRRVAELCRTGAILVWPCVSRGQSSANACGQADARANVSASVRHYRRCWQTRLGRRSGRRRRDCNPIVSPTMRPWRQLCCRSYSSFCRPGSSAGPGPSTSSSIGAGSSTAGRPWPSPRPRARARSQRIGQLANPTPGDIFSKLASIFSTAPDRKGIVGRSAPAPSVRPA